MSHLMTYSTWTQRERDKNRCTFNKATGARVYVHVTNLLRQLGLHFLLQPPEQEGAEHFVQTTDNQNGLFLVQVHLQTRKTSINIYWHNCRETGYSTFLIRYLLSSHGERSVEPLLKSAAALEDSGQQEVEQRPELGQLVLQRCAGEQHTPRRQVVRVQHLSQFAVMVLHTMPLVHDHVLPAQLNEADDTSLTEHIIHLKKKNKRV